VALLFRRGTQKLRDFLVKTFSLLEEGTKLRSITYSASKCQASITGKLHAGSLGGGDEKPLLMSVVLSVILVSIPTAGFSNDLPHRFGIGLGHPYLALKYGLILSCPVR